MTSQATCQFLAKTDHQTRLLGRCIGERLQSGTTIKLTGGLGSGKTCFVQGLARGLGIAPEYDITSPTYALIHEYPGRLPLIHVDLYRISGESDAEAIGLWDFIGTHAVVAVEWADRIEEAYWPRDSWHIDIQALADGGRRLEIIGYGLHFTNLIKEILAFWDAGGDDPAKP